MSILDTAFRLLGVTPAPAAEAPSRHREAAGVTVDADEDGWRRLGQDTRRDLSPVTQTRMQELAAYLWEVNPLANRLVELPIAFVLGEGVTLTASDPQAAEWLAAFWYDPVNRLDRKLEAKMRALALFGEQCWPVFVNEASGHVRLGYLDPALIDQVITDPENGEQPIVVKARRGTGRPKLYRVIVNGDEDDLFPAGSGARKLRDAATDGDAFYFRVNDLPNGRRGRSDLLAVADYCDAYDQLMWGELERAAVLRASVWDVTMKGATPDQVAARAREVTAPSPLSVRVHNDSEEWQALSPQLGAGDATAATRLFLTHVVGGRSMPVHWFGSGDDVNRASAAEMGGPAEKVLTLRQNWWKATLEDVALYVVRQRLAAIGRDVVGLASDPAYRPKASFPELSAKDTTKYAAALQQIIPAAAAAIERSLLTEETAVLLIAAIAGRLGVAIDAKEELENARQEAADRAAADAFSLPPDEFDLAEGGTGADA